MAKNTVKSYLSLDLPKTRIMATIGKENLQTEKLEEMIKEGATIFRFNAARIEKGIFEFKDKKTEETTPVDIKPILSAINHLSEELRQPIATSLDLAGPKVRVKKFISYHNRREAPQNKEDDKQLKNANDERQWNQPEIGNIVYLYSKDVDWNADHIKETLSSIEPINTQKPVRIDEKWRIQTSIENFDTVEKYISIKDGMCNLRIQSRSPKNDFVEAIIEEVAYNFFFEETQGVNPKGYLFPEILQPKDFDDFRWGLENDFDLICVSFVCSPLEYFELKKKMVDFKKNGKTDDWHPPLIFAKIETIFAVNEDEAKNYCQVKNLKDPKVYEERVPKDDHERYLRLIDLYIENPIKAICETFDGVMVARGDLAVEADKYHVPFYQKGIVDDCRLCNKPVIIATEVLESMKKKGSPSTRAEIGDIATAVVDDADVIMLAGEVASTDSDPASVVKELKKAIQTAEDSVENETWMKKAGDIKYFYDKFSSCSHEAETHLEEMKDKKLMPSNTVESVRLKIGMGSKVCIAARARNASAIFVSATSGETSKYVSYFRPPQKIISIGSSMEVARRLLLWKGIYPVVMQYKPKYELNDFILIAREVHSEVHIMPIAKKSEKEEEEKKGKKKINQKKGVEKEEFVVPALLRIESKLQDGERKMLLPNTVHDISLPKTPKGKTPPGIPEREKKYILTKLYYDKLKEYLEKKVKQDLERKVKQDLEKKIKQFKEEKFKQDLEEEVKQDLEGKVKQDLEGKLKQYLEDEKVKQDLEEKFKQDLEKEIKQKSKFIEQDNYYFHDKSGVIKSKEAMVRIRFEKMDKEPDRIVLTVKKAGKKVEGGTAERWEKEFNVTSYLKSKDLKNSFKGQHLPVFFRDIIYKEFHQDFEKNDIDSSEKIEFENIAKMTNTRLTVETHSELVLELDSFSTKKGCNYYELEIETIQADEDKRDEYVELLFGSLGIKVVFHEDYPPKSVMTLLDFGHLEINEKFRNAIDIVCKELNISKRGGCAGACN